MKNFIWVNVMEKTSLTVILNECFEKEENCAILHLADSSDLLLFDKPSFFNLHMEAILESKYDDNIIIEKCMIPFSSVLYVTVISRENLKIVHDYEHQRHHMMMF